MSYTQTDLDNIDDALKMLATTGVAEIEIDGERTKYLSLSELSKFRDRVASEIYAVGNESAIIKVRFVDVD